MVGKEQVLIEAIRSGDANAALKLLAKNSSVIKKANTDKSETNSDIYPSKFYFKMNIYFAFLFYSSNIIALDLFTSLKQPNLCKYDIIN